MKKLLALVTLAILMASCERVEGQLNVTKELKLKDSNGDVKTLAIGSHNADLKKTKFTKKMILRLNNNQDEKFEFKIPDNFKIPSNGIFQLSSTQIGQNVDLVGSVSTTSTNSEVFENYQSCTYQMPVQECHTGPNGQTTCQVYYRTVNGTQWVRYYNRHSTQSVHMNINQKGSTDAVADFHGNLNWTDRVILNESPCR